MFSYFDQPVREYRISIQVQDVDRILTPFNRVLITISRVHADEHVLYA